MRPLRKTKKHGNSHSCNSLLRCAIIVSNEYKRFIDVLRRRPSGEGRIVARSVVSLFSGCGGLDAGFSGRGFKVIEAHDSNDIAIETYNANRAPVGRVTDLARSDIVLPQADVVVAGPPCQGFSTIGSLRQDDNRNLLLLTACNSVLAVRPKLLILENVMGLTSVRNRQIFDTAIAMLSDYGYYVDVTQVSAANFGVAQRRKRLLIFARRDKIPFNIEMNPSTRETTVRDSIYDMFIPPTYRPVILKRNSKARRIAEKISPGQKLCNVRESPASVHTWDIPSVFGAVTSTERELLNSFIRLRRTDRQRSYGDADPVSIARINAVAGKRTDPLLKSLLSKGYIRKIGKAFDLTHTFNGTYRRLCWDSQSPTVDTHFGDPRLFLHPSEHRGMSVPEAAALQGFPARFIWPASERAAFRLIGNAVPPPISFALANFARSLLS